MTSRPFDKALKEKFSRQNSSSKCPRVCCSRRVQGTNKGRSGCSIEGDWEWSSVKLKKEVCDGDLVMTPAEDLVLCFLAIGPRQAGELSVTSIIVRTVVERRF